MVYLALLNEEFVHSNIWGGLLGTISFLASKVR